MSGSAQEKSKLKHNPPKFELTLDVLFTIAPHDVMKQIKIEDDKQFLVAEREPRGDVTAGINTHVDRKEIQKKKLSELLILHTQTLSSNPQSIAWSPSDVDMMTKPLRVIMTLV